MRFVQVGAEIQDVFAVGEITGFPIGFAEAGVVRGALVGRAERTMVEEGRRANGVQEARHLLGDTRAADLDSDFFGVAFVDGFAHARGHFVVRLVPSDALPLAFAACADAFERVQHALGIGVDRGAGLTFGAQAFAVVRVFWIAADFDQFAVNHIGLNATHGGAVEANALDDFGFGVVVFTSTIAADSAGCGALADEGFLGDSACLRCGVSDTRC